GGGAIMSAMEPRFDTMARSRRSVALNLKKPGAAEAALELICRADAVLEGFRPGVMERLGLGPEVCLARNPKLVYGRMTGWGEDGPWSAAAWHDIYNIVLADVLHMFGKSGAPPLMLSNLFCEFGGGGMLLAFGVVCALLEDGRF